MFSSFPQNVLMRHSLISEIGQYVCKIAKEIQMEQDIDLRRRLQELQVVVPPTTCCKCNEIRLQKRHTDMSKSRGSVHGVYMRVYYNVPDSRSVCMYEYYMYIPMFLYTH